jgi:hypothetical protein
MGVAVFKHKSAVYVRAIAAQAYAFGRIREYTRAGGFFPFFRLPGLDQGIGLSDGGKKGDSSQPEVSRRLA